MSTGSEKHRYRVTCWVHATPGQLAVHEAALGSVLAIVEGLSGSGGRANEVMQRYVTESRAKYPGMVLTDFIIEGPPGTDAGKLMEVVRANRPEALLASWDRVA